MALELSTHKLDFDIHDEDLNLKTLVFIDKSYYREDPDKPKLEVILPGGAEPKVVPINNSQVNIINSAALGITNPFGELSDLKDGIYTLTYRICPYDLFCVKKLYLRTVSLQYKLWDVLITKESFSKEEQKKLFLFDKLIKAGKAFAAKDNAIKAQFFYKEAENIINSIKTSC